MKRPKIDGGRTVQWGLGLLAIAGLAVAGMAVRAGDGDSADQYNAEEVIKKAEGLMRGESAYSEMTMTVHNPAWPSARSYSMKSWDDRKGSKSFIRIISPARDRGKAFLKVGEVFKVYIPTERENKPMTVPPSLMLQPWMGSNFTNDDLVHESSVTDDYTQKVEGVEKDGEGRTLVRVRLDPKPDAPVVWGKIVYWVDASNFLPTRQTFYDEDGIAVREMVLSEVKRMGGRLLPTVWEMNSLEADKQGEKTVIVLERIEFDLKIDDDIFTDKNLTRRDWE